MNAERHSLMAQQRRMSEKEPEKDTEDDFSMSV